MEATDDAAELVQWALDVWRDETKTHEQRERAHAWLTNRSIGSVISQSVSQSNATMTLATTTGPGLPEDWDSLPPAERLAFVKRLKDGRGK